MITLKQKDDLTPSIITFKITEGINIITLLCEIDSFIKAIGYSPKGKLQYTDEDV